MRCNDYVRIMLMVDSENSEFFVYLHFDTACKEKNIFNRVIGTLCIPTGSFGLWNGKWNTFMQKKLCDGGYVVCESVTWLVKICNEMKRN